MRDFLPFVRRHWKLELLLLALMLFTSVAALASPYILKILIDEVFPNKNHELLTTVLLILVAIYMVRIAGMVMSDYIYEVISNRIVSELRIKIFDHLLAVDFDFYRKNTSSDLVYKIYNEVDKIKDTLTNGVIRLLNNAFNIIGVVFMLCFLNAQLFVVSALVFPLVFLSVKYFGPRIRKILHLISVRESDLTSFFGERFSNIKLIKSSNSQVHESLKLSNKLNELLRLNLSNGFYSSLNRNFSTFFDCARACARLRMGW